MGETLIGQVLLDRYRVDHFVASGSMGAVYQVWDLKMNVALAMKVLHGELADDPSMYKSFQREARALERLAHPHIVRFYGLHQTEDFPFFLEGFIDGPTVKDILKRRLDQPLPFQEALVILKALGAALGYAHANGVVHCDIKPGNMMIDPGGTVLLTDFGIARHAGGTTTTLSSAGTPAYMAPEQVRGEPVTPATDVYALGVLLYELLSGKRPFRGEAGGAGASSLTQNERIRRAHLNEPPPDPRTWNPAIPPAVAQVILQALAKDPAGRYEHAMAFFEAVCQAAQASPDQIPDRLPQYGRPAASAGPVSPPGPPDAAHGSLPRPSNRSPVLLWAGLGGFGLIVLVSLVFLAGRMRPPLTPPAGRETTQAAGAAAQGFTPSPTLSPDGQPVGQPVGSPTRAPTRVSPLAGPPTPTAAPPVAVPDTGAGSGGRWLAFAADADQYDRDLFLMDLQSNQVTQLTFDRGGSNAPTFSPDAARLAFTVCPGNTCSLALFDLDSKAKTPLDIPGLDPRFPDWCRDPAKPWIAFEGREPQKDRRDIWLYDLENSRLTQLTRGQTDISPAWSPDCSQIVFERYDPASWISDLYLYDLASQTERQLTFTPGQDEINVAWSPDGNWIAYGKIGADTSGDGRITYRDQIDLARIRPDGTGEENLTAGRYSIFSPTFSPGGQEVIFTAYYSEGVFDLVRYSFVTQEFETLTTQRGPYFHPDWSP